MTAEHLPILQVAVPLALAPVCLLIGNRHLVWLLATAGGLFTFVCAAFLMVSVFNQGPLTYYLGGWEAPWGIALAIDLLSAFILLLVGLVATLTLIWGKASIENEIPGEQLSLFYCMFMLAVTGALGIVATGDAFNVFVFLEISSLSSYAMIAMGRDRRALTSSFQYLVMGTIGATFILIAIGLLYMMTGTLNMADLAARLPAVRETTTVLAAFAFLTVGVSLKIALLPLHQWLPNAYTYAPSVVSAFLSATSTKVSLYLLIRFFYTVFGADFVFRDHGLQYILMPLSLIAIFAASGIAIFQKDIKRMLAYSSIAQIGYMTLGIALVSQSGLAATIITMFNHGLIKGALFLAIGGIFLRTGTSQLAKLGGIGRTMPWTMGAVVIGGCGLIGVPLTAGFVAKWYLIVAVLEGAAWVVASAIVLTSLLTVVYVWRTVEILYFKTPGDSVRDIDEVPMSMLIPTWLMVAMVIWLGIDTTLTVGRAEQAAAMLFDVTP